MEKILWHRRESRRKTEKTNVFLQPWKAPAYSKSREARKLGSREARKLGRSEAGKLECGMTNGGIALLCLFI